jgi:flavin reductase (DIM6/NTAB) family NADH-FMN oxidoreductase RutF
MKVDTSELRSTLGAYPTGVTVVTAQTPSRELVGITVNSFSSVSLDPPLVLFSLQRTLRSLDAFARCACFAVNVLREDQEGVSTRFARSSEAKWADVAFTEHSTGAPILSGATAWLACEHYARYDGGDHEIFVGRVVALEHDETAAPLVFCRGRYHRLAARG